MKKDMYSFFDMNREQEMKKESPLALRMRPEALEEFVGQEDIVAPGKLLYRAIKADKLTSLIFFGPPGTGKTTLAKIIANTTESYFEQLNAVTSGVGDIRRVVEEAKTARECTVKGQFFLLMRFTVLTKPNRMQCFHMWRMVLSY